MDDKIKSIDGLPLPKYLVKLISQDRWTSPADVARLKQLTGFMGKTDFVFLSVAKVVRVNKLSHLIDDPKVAYTYGHASSRCSYRLRQRRGKEYAHVIYVTA